MHSFTLIKFTLVCNRTCLENLRQSVDSLKVNNLLYIHHMCMYVNIHVLHTLKGLKGKGVAHALAVQVMTVELASFAVISLNLVDLEERKNAVKGENV